MDMAPAAVRPRATAEELEFSLEEGFNAGLGRPALWFDCVRNLMPVDCAKACASIRHTQCHDVIFLAQSDHNGTKRTVALAKR